MTSERSPRGAAGDASAGASPSRDTLLEIAAYAALLITGFVLRQPGLDPAAFRNDDSWLAVVIRKMSWQEYLEIGPPVPIGFRLLQQIAASLSGDPEWPLQLVPLLASLLLPVLAGLLVRRLCQDRWAGLLAAAWTLVSPAWVELSVRPKQFATDALFTLVVVLLAVRAWQAPDAARLRAFLFGCVAALSCSFSSILVILPALAVTLWVTRARPVPVGALVSSLLALALLVLLAQSQSGEALRGYWLREGAFMPRDSAASAWTFVRGALGDVATGGFPKALPGLALVAGLGIAGLATRATGRRLLLVIAGVFVGLLTANGLGLYPVDAGRLSAFHRPLAPVLLAAGAWLCVRWIPAPGRSLVLVLLALAALPFAERSRYRASQDAEAARAVSDRIGPDDTVLAFVRGAHGLGYYTSRPIEITPDRRVGAGFLPRLAGDDVHYLWLGTPDAIVTAAELDRTLASLPLDTADRIVFVPPRFGEDEMIRRSRHAVSRLQELGFRRAPRVPESPYVLVLERRIPLQETGSARAPHSAAGDGER